MSEGDASELAAWEARRIADCQAYREEYPDEVYPGEAEAAIQEVERKANLYFERFALHEAGHAIVDYATGAHIIFMSVKPEINSGSGLYGQTRVRNPLMPHWLWRVTIPAMKATMSGPSSCEELAIECQRYLAGEAAERLAQDEDATKDLLTKWNGTNQDCIILDRPELRETCQVVFDFFNSDVALSKAFVMEQYQCAGAILHRMQAAIQVIVDRLRSTRSLLGDDVCAIITAAC